jgi:hypothetical protein
MAWYDKWVIMVITAAVGVAGYYSIPWCRMGVAEWAYWVGAIGSIGSIAGAYFLGERQSKAALRAVINSDLLTAYRKGKAVLAVADAAKSNTSGIMQAFDGDDFSYLVLICKYDGSIMDSLNGALAAIPVHELGSYKAVAAFLRIRTSMIRFQLHIKSCINRAEETQNSETGSIKNLHTFDTTALRMCMEDIVTCNEVLAKEVEDLAPA